MAAVLHDDPAVASSNLVSLRRRLLRWFRSNGRDFPWRQTRDPWAVLLAELMLQRTRADLVVPVYVRALDRYPTAAEFAAAPSGDVAELVRPLGFDHRNARLQAAAAACASGVPSTMAGLLQIPGVGRYAATATLSFAYGRRVAVVDPSVIRVLDRLGLIQTSRARARDDPAVWAAAEALLPRRDARSWNYAMLDLGARICRVTPRCSECPLLGVCPTGSELVRSSEASRTH